MSDVASGSQLDAFAQCRRKHYYAYDLGLAPPNKGKAITLGTAGHALLSAYYRAVQAGARHAEAVDTALGMASWTLEVELGIDSAIATTAVQLCQVYWAVYADDHRWLQVLAVEKEYRAMLSGVEYAATIDLVVSNTLSGEIEVWDHRFLSSFYDEHLVVVDPQLPRYVSMLRSLGIPVAAAARNMIRTSKAALAPEARLRRVPIPVDQARLQVADRERDQLLAEWVGWKQLPLPTRERMARRTFSQSCGYCHYRRPCALDAAGEDSTAVLESDYIPRSYGYEETL